MNDTPDFSVAESAPETIQDIERSDDTSSIFKLGGFITSLAENIYEKFQYTSIAVRTDPLYYSKRAAQTTIVGAGLLPFNEAFRYGMLGFALENTTGGPLVGAATLGLATLAVEAPTALSAASLLETEASTKTIHKINSVAEKIFKGNIKMNPTMEAGVALIGGSAVVLFEKQREDDSRTLQQNRRHGLFTASWMSAYFTAEGAFIGYNSTDGSFLNPKSIGATLIAAALTGTWARIASRKRRKYS